MSQINLPQGVVSHVARVPLKQDAVDLLEAVAPTLGLTWSEGEMAQTIRQLLATHPAVVQVGKTRRNPLTKAEIIEAFKIQRGSRVAKKKDE